MRSARVRRVSALPAAGPGIAAGPRLPAGTPPAAAPLLLSAPPPLPACSPARAALCAPCPPLTHAPACGRMGRLRLSSSRDKCITCPPSCVGCHRGTPPHSTSTQGHDDPVHGCIADLEACKCCCRLEHCASSADASCVAASNCCLAFASSSDTRLHTPSCTEAMRMWHKHAGGHHPKQAHTP